MNMPQVQFDSQTVHHDALRRFAGGLLERVGLLPADARLVADMLVEANLRGTDSHGVARLPHYLRRIGGGSIKPRPQITVEKLSESCGRVHGDDGLGQLVMQRATMEAVCLAAKSGAGWVSVARSSHCGAMAYYGLEIADAGMIGFVFSHVDSMVLPFGSRKAFCGTNPICITAPRADGGAGQLHSGALCLDMATSKVPWNTIANAAIEGVPIEQGWAVDSEGRDTIDAAEVASLYPFGEYKGSGLGLMIDVLCATLSDAPLGPDIPKMYGDMTEPRQLGGMVGALDIGRFVPLRRFHQRIDDLVRRWTALPPSMPEQPVLFPGQPELLERESRLRDGIPLGLNLLRELEELAEKYRLVPMFEGLRDSIGTLHGPHVLARSATIPAAE
ncbi:MAG: Ldh family oxidoreductase [Pirellulaceae bacterium]|nr:Ldh family oxidoreductase [Pirellulaceae bacterium]